MTETQMAVRPDSEPAVLVPTEQADAAQADQLGAYASAGTLQLTKQQAQDLAADFPEDAYEVKPTSEVYVSQVHYRRLLNKVFGPGAWALVPRSGWINHADTVCREYALYVRGVFVAEAIGETDYQPNNDRMSYASAAEGCRSNALTRCCKDLGIASTCWDRKWADAWRAEHCVQVWHSGQKKPQWRLKTAEPWHDETGVVDPGAAGRGQRSSAPAGPLCPQCKKPGRESKYAKPGATHYCPTCKVDGTKGDKVSLTFAAESAPAAPAALEAPAAAAQPPAVNVVHELVEAGRILSLTPSECSAALKSLGYASSKDVPADKLDAAMNALDKAAKEKAAKAKRGEAA